MSKNKILDLQKLDKEIRKKEIEIEALKEKFNIASTEMLKEKIFKLHKQYVETEIITYFEFAKILKKEKSLQEAIEKLENILYNKTKKSAIVLQKVERNGKIKYYAYRSFSYWNKEKKQSRSTRKLLGSVSDESAFVWKNLNEQEKLSKIKSTKKQKSV